MSSNADYWTLGERGWPIATATHVPLALAVFAIGEAQAPIDWTGKEGSDHAANVKKPHLDRFLRYASPRQRDLAVSILGLSADVRSPLDEHKWSEARRLLDEKYRPYQAGQERLRNAQNEIRRAAIWNEIETFVRFDGSITMYPIPPDAWSVISSAVFERCRVNPRDWNTTAFDGRDFGSVFVSRSSLDALANSKSVDPASQTTPALGTPKPTPLEGPILRTGLPGRPSSLEVVIPEARRRAASGAFPDTQNQFFEQLSNWLKTTYPEAASAKVSAMKMNAELREIYRSAKATRDAARSKKGTRYRSLIIVAGGFLTDFSDLLLGAVS